MINTDVTHKRDYYTCKRLRLLNYLTSKGFVPFATIPEPTNIKFNWWLFENTPELQQSVTEYFNQMKENQLH
jgi:hypothetical protein